MKYGKCWKCGAIAETEADYLTMCCAPMSCRTSGICGGSFNEITKEEYDILYQQFKEKQNKQP